MDDEILLSDWKIWARSHQPYLVVKGGFQGSPGLCRGFTSKEETNGRVQARRQEKNCSDATRSRNQCTFPISAVLEPSWIHLLLSNQEFKMTYENHDDPEGKGSTQRVVRLHNLKFLADLVLWVRVCVYVRVYVRAQQTIHLFNSAPIKLS